jgi:hypothetical protein
VVEVDVCLPAWGEPYVVLDGLNRLVEYTKIPFGLTVINDGVGGEMTDVLRGWIQGNPDVPSTLLVNKKRIYFTRCCNIAASYGRAKAIAFFHPCLGVYDHQWAEKLLTVLRQDQRARCVTVDHEAKWSQNPPYHVGRNHNKMTRGLTMFRRIKGGSIRYWPEIHPHDSLFLVQGDVGKMGEHFWIHPAVRTQPLDPSPNALHDSVKVTDRDEVTPQFVMSTA